MRKIVQMSSKLKWLGLLGLPSLFSEGYLWKLLWLFWLFGLIELIFALPIMVQSLRQIVGIFICEYKNKPRPDKDNFIPKVKYSLPFKNSWVVLNGGVTKEFSHSWAVNSQRYAYDFVMMDQKGNSHSGNFKNKHNYFCYDQEILAPADGMVVAVKNDCRDSRILGEGQTDPIIKDIRGNYIVIQHAENEYSCVAHLKPQSILVTVGEKVERKQLIALCGNTGNSSEPHLHFQLQNGKSFFNAAGLPIYFAAVERWQQPNYHFFDRRSTSESSKFLIRGMGVRNKVQ
ncbi:M23 family metallopeptidase [Enterococcus alishanensis]|uniref:M23 family metallopeptidase n=1 Tax=Enterococcus alishanensis TaxID=1303817 RepID=A0ABS6TDQ3_9ENTE|nr:M23 family metallopeptidase [Enterococcus alishanensis]MBV7391017.1 M23 family metallopeptidase [Enterococcus alishanensis]